MQELTGWINDYPVLAVLFIIAARVVDVSLGTMRTIAVVRGYRLLAAALGFFEVIIWISAVSGVLHDIRWWKVIAYGVGFGLGNLTGVMLEGKMAMGQQMLTLISRHYSHALAFALRLADYRVTEIPAQGRDGPITMCLVVVSRRKCDRAIELARGVDADVQVVVEDVRSTTMARRPGFLATGWRALAKKK